MTHPFKPQIKNKDLKTKVEDILFRKGDNVLSNVFNRVEDLVSEATGYLVGDGGDETMLKAVRMVVLKKLQMHIEFNLLSPAEKESKLFFWEIHTTHNNKL